MYRTSVENFVGKSYRETMLTLANRNIAFRFTAEAPQTRQVPFTVSSQSVEPGEVISVFDGCEFNVVPPAYISADRVFGLVSAAVERPRVPVLMKVTRTPVNQREEDYFSMQFMNDAISFPYYDAPGTVYTVYMDGNPVTIHQVAK